MFDVYVSFARQFFEMLVSLRYMFVMVCVVMDSAAYNIKAMPYLQSFFQMLDILPVFFWYQP